MYQYQTFYVNTLRMTKVDIINRQPLKIPQIERQNLLLKRMNKIEAEIPLIFMYLIHKMSFNGLGTILA